MTYDIVLSLDYIVDTLLVTFFLARLEAKLTCIFFRLCPLCITRSCDLLTVTSDVYPDMTNKRNCCTLSYSINNRHPSIPQDNQPKGHGTCLTMIDEVTTGSDKRRKENQSVV